MNEFLEKYRNQKYISHFLYEQVKEKLNFPFDLETYNENILNKEYYIYKDYFENMFKEIDDNIILDDEQIKSILADEDYSLIIAGAGAGKTTTMVAKVKFLVDIKKVNPQKIVVMSYTRKATEELEKRIVIDFNIPVKVTTIHALGYSYIKEIFSPHKCYIVSENEKKDIFFSYFQERIFPFKNKVKQIIDNFKINHQEPFSKYFMNYYQTTNSFKDFFQKYKDDMLNETNDIEERIQDIISSYIYRDNPITINQEFVKSQKEAIIANFLYINNIPYSYEKIYPEFFEEHKIYKPDFTIHYGGEDIYLEYFGISEYDDGEMKRYQKIKNLKLNYHQKHHTKFIAIDTVRNEDVIASLKEGLLKYNIPLKPKTSREIYEKLLENNPRYHFFRLEAFFYHCIESIKSSPNRQQYKRKIDEYIQSRPLNERPELIIQFSYIEDFYFYYQSKLYGGTNYGFDFSDLIYYASMYIDHVHNNNFLLFEHIIIDEYQDISYMRYEFMHQIAKQNKAKITAVGDDWQSIFSFAGSNIEYIYNFQKYFKGAKLLSITNTYRNSQELINATGNFIMKNNNQIKKTLHSNKSLKTPFKFVLYDDEIQTLKELLKEIHEEKPEHNILILARTNWQIKNLFNDCDFKKSLGTKIDFLASKDLELEGMTMHKSKGLTYDEVIIIGLNENFPRREEDFWLDVVMKEKTLTENIAYPEERRLFYVALTRTKNHVFLLTNNNVKKRSPFLNELITILKEQKKAE